MSRPRVSLLMAVYNGEAFLDEALQSVRDQSFREFEVIIVNDGSTDRTGAIIEQWRTKDSRLRVLNQAHEGLVSALNHGLELARGEYVARMDADDVCVPERLAAQLAFMDAHPEVGISGTWIETFGTGPRIVRKYPVEHDAIRSALLFESVLAHPSVMMRRSMLIETGLRYDSTRTHAEDYDLWVRAAEHTNLANVPSVLLRYRLHPSQVVETYESQKIASAQRVRIAQIKRLGIDPGEPEIALHYAVCCWQFQATGKFLLSADAWLRLLMTANARAGIYHEGAFAKILGQRWSAICASATCLGLWTLKMFVMSPLRKGTDWNWLQFIKFAVKCAIRRRQHVEADCDRIELLSAG